MIEYRAAIALRNGQTREGRGKDRAGLVEELGTVLSEMSRAGARLV